MTKTITGKDIFQQLKADLLGKDSHRGVTFTYTWLANQLGHLSLGFIPTLVVYAFLRPHIPAPQAADRAAWGVISFWFLFESYNFLGPLLLNRVSRAKRLFVPGKRKYVFQPAWGNIAFDTATDLCFFGLGVISARFYIEPVVENSYILPGLLLILVFPCRYWYVTKMYLQAAGYPFQCRISQWAFDISEADKDEVETFLDSKKGNRHLLIFGGMGNGKTSLGVGIATEYSIRHKTCFYTTGMKLYSLFPERTASSMMHTKNLWTWRQASLLVIDDINPGGLIDDLITPGQFLGLLDAKLTNRDTLVNKDVIWVLGNDEANTLTGQKWIDMLHQIGIDDKNIQSIHLSAVQVASSH